MRSSLVALTLPFAIGCGNAFILKPSERDPGVPMRLAELMMEAGLPAGLLPFSLGASHGGRTVVNPCGDPTSGCFAVGLRPTPIAAGLAGARAAGRLRFAQPLLRCSSASLLPSKKSATA